MSRPLHRHSRPSTTAAFALAAALAIATPAAAQTIVTTPADPKRWDIAASAGWHAGNKEELAEDWNDWYDTFAAGVDVGRYWTANLKTEAGVMFTNEGDVFAPDVVAVPGVPYPVYRYREHHFRVSAASVSAVYQFLDNAWIHPFLGAGLLLAWEHERSFTPDQFVFGVDPRAPSPLPVNPPSDNVRFAARPFVSGGFKFYVAERAFIRTDALVAADAGGVANAAWRVGVGVDF